MNVFTLFPIVIIFFYLAFIIGILYLIYTWVNKFISLRQEQNELLKEIVRKMENKQTE
jgi:uncharacterized integral membrane protein